MARKRGRSYLRGLPCRVGSFFATLMSIAVEEPHRPSTFREDDRIPGCPHVAFLGRSCATRSLCALRYVRRQAESHCTTLFLVFLTCPDVKHWRLFRVFASTLAVSE